jgi:ribonuclease HII
LQSCAIDAAIQRIASMSSATDLRIIKWQTLSRDANCCIAGVDEVGRGPLAGPVVAAAVILDPQKPIAGIRDSKQLSAQRREGLFEQITQLARAWSLGRAEVDEIDQINILQASMLAMQRAIETLPIAPNWVLVDGNRCPEVQPPCEAIVKGDNLITAIAAASIVAKVVRDREMIQLHEIYPKYGFAQHKGYGTAAHLSALRQLGPLDCHRKSFAPIKSLLKN